LKHLLGEGDISLRKEKVTYEPKRSIIYYFSHVFCQFLNFQSNLSNQSRKMSNLSTSSKFMNLIGHISWS